MSTAWRTLVTADGSWTLVHPGHGEACHSRSGAWLEAVERFAVPCRLSACAREELRLLDVGTGIGLNIAAALAALAPTGARLVVDTLERDRSVLERAIEHARDLDGDPGPGADWHAIVLEALAGAADSPGEPVELGRTGRLRLYLGDARSTLETLAESHYHAVFLDPFSPRVEPDLWQPAFLARVARSMATGALLSTYSAATHVRAGLLAAGLGVGPGPSVGAKSEGTLAGRGTAVPAFEERVRQRIEDSAAELTTRAGETTQPIA